MKGKKINTSELKQNTIQNPILPKGFIGRVIEYKNILGEIDNSTVEEAVSNFQRDADPEKELKIWEKMADLYDSLISKNNITNLAEKREIFAIILAKSMEG
ncbi:MAG: hypothetical protein WCK10_03190 [Candidatus Staskawiczbacteria bacterium]